MELIKIKGNAYYINSPTNIGVYVFENKNCILIDTDISSDMAKNIEEVLLQNGLHPRYIINTHGHIDHYGGNEFFMENYRDCQVYTSKGEKLFMENPELQATILFSSFPPSKFKVCNPAPVDFILDLGVNTINEEDFHILSLKGHSIDQIGIETPEKVWFLGDAIFSEELIKGDSIPYIYNIEEYLNSLEKIKEIEGDFFIISHSRKVFSKAEIVELANLNMQNVAKFKDQILAFLQLPLTEQEILENLTALNDLNMGFKQYYLNLSSISAFITYLYEKGLIDSFVKDGKLYYFNNILEGSSLLSVVDRRSAL